VYFLGVSVMAAAVEPSYAPVGQQGRVLSVRQYEAAPPANINKGLVSQISL
jgi:hypothetical protein